MDCCEIGRERSGFEEGGGKSWCGYEVEGLTLSLTLDVVGGAKTLGPGCRWTSQQKFAGVNGTCFVAEQTSEELMPHFVLEESRIKHRCNAFLL